MCIKHSQQQVIPTAIGNKITRHGQQHSSQLCYYTEIE
jgi:hypothetical protein